MLPELGGRAVANIAHAFAKSRLVGGASYQGVWAALDENWEFAVPLFSCRLKILPFLSL